LCLRKNVFEFYQTKDVGKHILNRHLFKFVCLNELF